MELKFSLQFGNLSKFQKLANFGIVRPFDIPHHLNGAEWCVIIIEPFYDDFHLKKLQNFLELFLNRSAWSAESF